MHAIAARATYAVMAVATGQAPAGGAAPRSWEELRADSDIQFEPVQIPETPPREPSAFEEFMRWLAEQVGDLFGGSLGAIGPVLRWVLLALLIGAVLYMLWRIFDPLAARRAKPEDEGAEEEWRPDHAAAIALLEDADRLASEGKFDEATHLLLQRSVHQMASARPEWVEPSSTARELARLAALPDGARNAFATIAERVERSLFALRSLDQGDWETARNAYAEFALARLDRQTVEIRA